MCIVGVQPYFASSLGNAYLGDSLELLPKIEDKSIDLICTSPLFALLRKKAYGNVHADNYIEWFMQFAREPVATARVRHGARNTSRTTVERAQATLGR